MVLRSRELGATYAEAGLAVTAYAIASGVTEPFIARLADRIGQWPVLRVAIPLNATAFAVAAAAPSSGVLVVAAALIGASYPQVGGMARALLAGLLPDERRRTAAFALETATVEVLFIAAPAIFVAGIAASAGASVAFAAGGVLTCMGSTLFALSRASRGWRPERSSGDVVATLSTPTYRALVAAVLALGLALGAIEVGLTAFAEGQGRRAAVGWLLAISSAGSLAGGILAARLPPPPKPRRRLALLFTIQAVSTLSLLLPSSLAAMGPAIAVNGATVSPTMATVFTLTARVVPAGRITEGYAWLGTGVMIGLAIGAATGGFAVTHASIAVAFIVASTPLALIGALAGLPAPRMNEAHG